MAQKKGKRMTAEEAAKQYNLTPEELSTLGVAQPEQDAPIPQGFSDTSSVDPFTRLFIKNFATNPESARAGLEAFGFEVGDQIGSGFNFFARPKGSKDAMQPLDLNVGAGGFKEAALDVGDFATDSASGVITEVLGNMAGAAGFFGGAATPLPGDELAGALAGRIIGTGVAGLGTELARQFVGQAGGIPNNIDLKQAMEIGLLSMAFGGTTRQMSNITRAAQGEGAISRIKKFMKDTPANLLGGLSQFETIPGITTGEAIRTVARMQRSSGDTFLSKVANRITGRKPPKYLTIDEFVDDFQSTVRNIKDDVVPEAQLADTIVGNAEAAGIRVNMGSAVDAITTFTRRGKKIPLSEVIDDDITRATTMKRRFTKAFVSDLVDVDNISEPKIMGVLDELGRLPTDTKELDELLDALSDQDSIKKYVNSNFSPDEIAEFFFNEVPVAIADSMRRKLQKESFFDASQVAKSDTVRGQARAAQGKAREILGKTLDPMSGEGKEPFSVLRRIASEKVKIADDLEDLIGTVMLGERGQDAVARVVNDIRTNGAISKDSAAVLSKAFGDFNPEIRKRIQAFDRTNNKTFLKDLREIATLQAATEFEPGSMRRSVPSRLRLGATGTVAGIAAVNSILGRTVFGPVADVAIFGTAGALASNPAGALRMVRGAQGALERGALIPDASVAGTATRAAFNTAVNALSPEQREAVIPGNRERAIAAFQDLMRRAQFQRPIPEETKKIRSLPGI